MINLTVNLEVIPDHVIPVTDNGMTEHSILMNFFTMMEESNIKVTLFATLEVLQGWEGIQELAENPMIEFGGLENESVEPDWIKVWELLENSSVDYRSFETWRIAKTLELIRSKTGQSAISWRNQFSVINEEKVLTLIEHGVSLISSCQVKHASKPYWLNSNLLEYHVNIPFEMNPQRTIELKQRPIKEQSAGGSVKVAVQQRTDQIIETIIVNQIDCIPSNLVINPVNMYKQDHFEGLETELIEFLLEEETVHMSEIHYFELGRLHYANRNN